MPQSLPVGRILIAVLAAEILLVASTFLYMAIYGYLIDPGHPEAYYVTHVGEAAPIISIVAGALIFFGLAYWLARRAPAKAGRSALMLWGLFVFLDWLIVIILLGPEGLLDALPISALSHAVKLAAALFGARLGMRSAS